MSTELISLLVCSFLCLGLALAYGALYGQQAGMATITGNREGAPEAQGLAGRALRAHRNLLENLLPFAAVVLVAQAHGVSNIYTVGAAMAFVAARVIHAGSYIGGITGLRTLAWHAGVIATIVIGVQALLH